MMLALSTPEWAEVGAATFTALAALAAWAAVLQATHERRVAQRPDLHVELVGDLPNQETRLEVANYGGPAREVKVAGVLGPFGFYGVLPPTSQWAPGESRTIRVSIPPIDTTAFVFVEARDTAKRYLFVSTIGGATYRWPLRRAKKLSTMREWQRLFPESRDPLSVAHTPMQMELVERRR